MALDKNEKTLAQRMIGKLLFDKSEKFLSTEIIVYDVNKFGMVTSLGAGKDFFIIPRTADHYENPYQSNILDEMALQFKTSLKLVKRENEPMLELFTASNISILFDFNTFKLFLAEKNRIILLTKKETSKLKITPKTKDLIEKYSESPLTVIKALKKQRGITSKKELLAKVRETIATCNIENLYPDMYRIDKTAEDDRLKALQVLEAFYDKLKENYTPEKLAEEEELFNQATVKAQERLEKEYQEFLNSENEKIEKQEQIVKEKAGEVAPLLAKKDKLCFSGLTTDGPQFVRILHVDENGILEFGNKFKVRDFIDERVNNDNYHVLSEEFNQNNFVGKVFAIKNDTTHPFMLLFKNEQFSMLVKKSNIDNDIHFKIEKNSNIEKNYVEIKRPKGYDFKEIKQKFSELDNVIDHLNKNIDKKINKEVEESYLIDKIGELYAIKDENIKPNDISYRMLTEYQLDLRNQIIENYLDVFIEKYGYSREEIKTFYGNMEVKAREIVTQYNKEQDLAREKSLEKQKEHEIKIKETINARLLQGAIANEIAIEEEKEDEEEENETDIPLKNQPPVFKITDVKVKNEKAGIFNKLKNKKVKPETPATSIDDDENEM